jgi:hypothetical protein
MNLEAVERRCMAYLADIARPLAPIGQLLRHLHENPETADVSEAELLRFLRRHNGVAVVEAAGLPAEPGGAGAFAAVDIPTGPYAILKSRIPTAREWTEQFQTQMETMLSALETARAEAVASGDKAALGEVMAILGRARRLRERLGKLL